MEVSNLADKEFKEFKVQKFKLIKLLTELKDYMNAVKTSRKR